MNCYCQFLCKNWGYKRSPSNQILPGELRFPLFYQSGFIPPNFSESKSFFLLLSTCPFLDYKSRFHLGQVYYSYLFHPIQHC